MRSSLASIKPYREVGVILKVASRTATEGTSRVSGIVFSCGSMSARKFRLIELDLHKSAMRSSGTTASDAKKSYVRSNSAARMYSGRYFAQRALDRFEVV